MTCFICGQPEHSPTDTHIYWSTSDAVAYFEVETIGGNQTVESRYVAEYRPY